MSQETKKSARGLASASEETRNRVESKSGYAKHEKRGLQSPDSETRERIARMGGLARDAKYREERDKEI